MMLAWLRKALPARGKAASATQTRPLQEGISDKARGNAYLGEGKLEEAAACYLQAIAAAPGDADAHLNLGFVLAEQKRYAEAESSLREAITHNPALADAHYILGTLARAQGDLNAAIEHFGKALAIQPAFEIVYRDLGQVLFQTGQSERARTMLLQGLAHHADSAELHYCLGNVHAGSKEPGPAIDCFRKALSIEPAYVEAHNNLGLALQAQGRLDEAVACFRKALSLNPDGAEIYSNMGLALQAQGELPAAVQCYQKALALKPDYASAHNHLGNALQEQGKLDAAIESYRKALSFKPDYASAYSNLGGAFQADGQLDAAIESYRHALSLQPDFLPARSNMLFALSFHSNCAPAEYLAEARQYGSRVLAQARPYTRWPAAVANPAGCGRRALRVGLVSGDLKMHPVGFFLESILAHIDPARIELVAYPTRPQEDELTARITSRFLAWNPVVGLNDEAVAARIHGDGIQILIDLAGHTAHNRLPVFAWKPAPLQVSWLGYWASTGVPGMDYLLAGPESALQDQQHFTETLWRLPDTRLCFTPPAPETRLDPLPAIRNGYITFASFQNMSKITDAALLLWGRVFKELPQARLRLQSKQMGQAAARENMLQRLARAGIVPERVTMKDAATRGNYLAAHAEVDMVLDTFPFPGGTTTCEALWMGVPTLTLRGDTLLGRQGAGMLACAGLEEWIALDEDDFVNRAAAHAADIPRLAQLRAGLRERVLASPLFDAARFARQLEDALQGMWNAMHLPL